MKRLLIGLCVFCCATQFDSFSSGQEWTRFRGPNGQGISNSKTIPDEWTEADHLWKTKLPGIGHSSPVVWGDKVFLQSADSVDPKRHVLCISTTTGAILWTKSYPTKVHHLHAHNSYASSTPTVDAHHVYIAWATPEKMELKAFDHAGNEAWSVDLGLWVSQHGFAASPMLYEDLVILHNSQQTGRLARGKKKGISSMIALDRKSGEEIWRTPLIGVWNCYAVPCVRKTASGVNELICTSQGNGTFGLDPITGKFNWAVKGIFQRRVCSSPVLAGDLILGSAGTAGGGNYVVAVNTDPEPAVAYEIRSQAPYVPTLIARDDLLFAWTDRGICSCFDAASGESYWRERIGGNYSGSPVIANNKIYCIDQDGVVVVLAAEKEFKLISRNPLGEPSRATPAVSGGRMFLRTYSHLIAIGGE